MMTIRSAKFILSLEMCIRDRIWGTQDVDTPLWMGEVMEKEIPDAALILLEGCGHFAYLEKYADFKAIAWKFLIG